MFGKKKGQHAQEVVIGKPTPTNTSPLSTFVRSLGDMCEKESHRVQHVWTFSVGIL